jgi:hypothetical protein
MRTEREGGRTEKGRTEMGRTEKVRTETGRTERGMMKKNRVRLVRDLCYPPPPLPHPYRIWGEGWTHPFGMGGPLAYRV